MNLSLTDVPSLISAFLIAIAIVAIVVSVIVELTKNTKPLDKIPTELEVIVLSVAGAVLAIFVLASIYNFDILWYYIVGAVIVGLFSAYVTMFGWEKLITIVNKFKTPAELRDVYKLTSTEKKKIENLLENTSEDKEDFKKE